MRHSTIKFNEPSIDDNIREASKILIVHLFFLVIVFSVRFLVVGVRAAPDFSCVLWGHVFILFFFSIETGGTRRENGRVAGVMDSEKLAGGCA